MLQARYDDLLLVRIIYYCVRSCTHASCHPSIVVVGSGLGSSELLH